MKRKSTSAVVAAACLAASCVQAAVTVTGPKPFGKLSDGRETHIWRIDSGNGLILDVTDYGGRLVRAYAPDRHGNLADVTLGWNTAAEYETYGFSMGTLVGRYANRIADGRFTLDGVVYQLPINENKPNRHNTLHGGPEGWSQKVWKVQPYQAASEAGLVLACISKDGEMGFPGTVTATITYRVTTDNRWIIDYEATTDKPTIINLTHHSYWNLAGEASGDVRKQEIQIFADSYTQTDKGLIPTRDALVEGTGMDFRQMRPLDAWAGLMAAEKAFAPMDNWYDHNFVLRGKAGEMRPAATLHDPVSGRVLEIQTTEPCMQMYGAQNMTFDLPAKTAGKKLCPFAGVALETQHYPDSPNHPEFPTTVLRPGETFKSRTAYHFTVR